MKHLILVLFLLSGLNAEDFVFIVENATMVDAYWNIFNSMAALFQNSEYNSLLQLAFLVGGFGVFFAGVLKGMGGGNGQGSIMDFTKYMVVGMSLLTLVYSHTSNIIVKTNNIPSFCSTSLPSNVSQISSTPTTGVVVGNIPTMLAWAFSGLNTVGVESTKLAKLAFTPLSGSGPVDPNARSGFADYLAGIGAISSLSIENITNDSTVAAGMSTVGAGLIGISNDCILIPASQDPINGPTILNAMKQTGNLKMTINELITRGDVVTYKNPTTLTPNTLASNITIGGITPDLLLVNTGSNIQTCGEAWTALYASLETLKNSTAIECSNSLRDVVTPSTIGILTGDMGLGTVPMARDIALNAAMANEVFDSKRNLAIGSEVSFAAGKSMSEFTTNSLGSGYYMAQMLPYLQMGIRAVLYAFFPFVFVVILLPGGIKVLISYLQSLVWVELWTPTAAILDMFMGLVSTEKFANMYNEKGFNPTNSVQTFSDAAMLASVAGYLYASVPALTYLILKGSAQMLGNITSGVASGMSKNLDSRTINQDIGSLKQRQAVNAERVSNGEKMVSLAEMDSMSAGHLASSTAGSWLTNEANKADLTRSSMGDTQAKITGGLGSYKALNSDAAKQAVIADAVGKNKALQATLVSTGIQDAKTGKIDFKRLQELKTTEGVKSGAMSLETEKEIKELQKFTGSKDFKEVAEKYGDLMGDKKLAEYAKFESQVQTTMADNKGMTREQAAVHVASVQGQNDAYNSIQKKKELDTIAGKGNEGTLDKEGRLVYNDKGRENITNTLKSSGVLDGTTKLATNDVINSFSQSDIQKSMALGQANTIGKNLSNAEVANIQLDAMDKGGVNTGDLNKKLSQINSNKNLSPAQKELQRTAAITQTYNEKVGVEGTAYTAVANDVKARVQHARGTNATASGNNQANEFEARIQGNAAMGAQMLSDGGASAQAMQAAMAHFGHKNWKKMSDEDKSSTTMYAKSLLSNEADVFQASVGKYKTQALKEEFKGEGNQAKFLARMNARGEGVQAFIQQNMSKVMSSKDQALIESFTKGAGYMKSGEYLWQRGAQFINGMENLMKNNKGMQTQQNKDLIEGAKFDLMEKNGKKLTPGQEVGRKNVRERMNNGYTRTGGLPSQRPAGGRINKVIKK